MVRELTGQSIGRMRELLQLCGHAPGIWDVGRSVHRMSTAGSRSVNQNRASLAPVERGK